MPSTTINPTRMELTRLKGRLKTAQRGHKLLKDKRDELMKQFMDVVRENRALRRRVEEGLMRAHGAFTVAAALMSPEMLEQSLLYPKQSVELDMTFENVMLFQMSCAFFRSSIQIKAPFNAPTDVPATAWIRIPASFSAFHAPI